MGFRGFRQEVVSGLPSKASQSGPPGISTSLCGQESFLQGPNTGPTLPGATQAAVLPASPTRAHRPLCPPSPCARRPPVPTVPGPTIPLCPLSLVLTTRAQPTNRCISASTSRQWVGEEQGGPWWWQPALWPSSVLPLSQWRATRGLIKPDGGKTRVEAQRRFYT